MTPLLLRMALCIFFPSIAAIIINLSLPRICTNYQLYFCRAREEYISWSTLLFLHCFRYLSRMIDVL